MRQPHRALLSISLLSISLAVALAASSATAHAQTAPSYDELAKREAAANAEDGKRVAPLKSIGNPSSDVSPEMQAMIGEPYPPHFNADPKTPAEWKELIDRRAKLLIAGIPAMKAKLGVKVEETRIAGVHCYIVTPNKIALENRRRLLIHVHGGGYVFGPGEAALPEAIMMAAFGGYKVISVDYRMPPDFPYPAAMDDAMAVWKEVLKSHERHRLAIFGTSTGGAMTLAMVLRARDEKLPLPAAIAPGTPWSDIDKIGDSYASNEWVDNVLVTWDGWLGRAAKLYASGTSLKNPYISPIYGDFKGFPPTILTSGTRDLFLSNTVRTHRKLRRAGVIADLNVYEGQSHAQYQMNIDAPETKEAFTDIAKFFDRYLKQ
ncbi:MULTISPECIES: alpha/beta hydrolase [unclassified Bradyrhizobium]|uniref:alpha/beta hydrolase n=1 Tax=unclassified Bradyrhizobium TaxID=2631580 RepID=UPI001BA47E7F|nr:MULTISPECIES: alpha/beta hydrolase [unclassified Bradyrhizobium]MBR1207640.1 alpha/beta hydrolase [Bradyrhizobium sp. AUGA SZCCT0124]MBR1317037.1 alpha/beta hydrolase [Bradyrhizobium sp. AUGA SZCCT0051]MBR1345514.1 alpha/beta hydrolase [Bradyrhizobium sp. AUGA SZCCT0105]MBR1360134.1 alpha/beta hydrolase [Bradyrhizobium sp. AUGA SZCCT0045]